MTIRGRTMERIMLMPDHRKNRLILRIIEALYSDENEVFSQDHEWTQETIENVAELLMAYELTPNYNDESSCQVASTRQQSSIS